MNWISATIGINIGFKLGVVLILIISFLENRNKVICWWIIGWFFLILHSIFNFILLENGNTMTFFINDMCLSIAAVAFLESIGHMKYKIYGQHHWISINLFILSGLIVYYLTFFRRDYQLSDNFVSLINGICLVICSIYYFRSEKICPSTQFIFVGLLIGGIHSLIYSILEPRHWLTHSRFILSGLFSLIFGIGLIIRSFENLLRRKILTEMMSKKLSFIDKISKSVTRPVNLDLILDDVLGKVLELSGIDCGCIYVFDEVKEELVVRVSRGFSYRYIQHYGRLKKDEGIAGMAIMKHHAQIIDDLRDLKQQKEFNIARQEKVVTLISIPLISKEIIVGALDIAAFDKKVFDKPQLQLLSSIADAIAVSIENTKLYNSMEQIYMHTITALAKAIDAKDAYTRMHSEQVAMYAAFIADELNLSDEEKEKLKLACCLHDIGKIAIDDSILTKPTALNDQEWKIMKSHSQKGADILEPLQYLYGRPDGILDLIKYHHERCDGKGYPQGYLDKDIPLGAKILTIADAYDAMITDRAYRKALTSEEARKELLRCSDTQFDAKIVKVFLRVLDRLDDEGHKK
ncbi:MAG: HD domain-containing phosphohydrolase [Candidatus Omnitrophota bacterium]